MFPGSARLSDKRNFITMRKESHNRQLNFRFSFNKSFHYILYENKLSDMKTVFIILSYLYYSQTDQ